jgi:hypothetical protein
MEVPEAVKRGVTLSCIWRLNLYGFAGLLGFVTKAEYLVKPNGPILGPYQYSPNQRAILHHEVVSILHVNVFVVPSP